MQIKRLISEIFAFLMFIALLGVYIYFQHLQVENPEITSITPEIGNPGDVVEIQGLRFGENDNSSERKKPYNCSVFIGNRRLVLSDYLLWSDEKIEIKLPADIRSGRLWVETEKGRSNAMLFINRQEIPVTESTFHAPGMPYIGQISGKSPSIGDTIVIHGSGFGYEQGGGYVLFPLKAPADRSSIIGDVREFAPPYGEYAYEAWSDTEISLHIPDGATTGPIYVVTGAGSKSNPFHLEMSEPKNQKQYVSPSGYRVEYNLEVHNLGSEKNNTIYAWMPEFITSPEQRNTATATDRQPSLASYRNTNLYMFQGIEVDPAIIVHNTATFQRYKITSKITTADIRRDYNKNSNFYKNYTKDEEVITKNASGAARELSQVTVSKNPYIMCRNIYNYIMRLKRASSLEYAMLFTSMVRKSGIPARPVCGFIVDKNNNTQLHYWAEFFIMGIGWLPVDLQTKSFAALEADHVTLSRGTVELPQINPAGHILEPKYQMYAFQNIYSEVLGPHETVAVLWNDMNIISRW